MKSESKNIEQYTIYLNQYETKSEQNVILLGRHF